LAKLRKEQIVAIGVLKERGQSQSATARLLGVTEGAVRYHLRRQASGAVDGRRKSFLLEQLGLAEVVQQWWQCQTADAERPPSVEALVAFLREEYQFAHSYKAVLRYVRAKFPAPQRRPFRRVETPPGAQTQSDWLEHAIDIGGNGPTKLFGFIMRLSHSRKKAVVWSRTKDQLAWLRCHNDAFKRLGGVAAINRIDNEKTAISVGAGPWGQINACYRAYARSLGFHVDACEPRSPEQKGKVERGVREIRQLNLSGRCFLNLEHLQEYTDAKLEVEAQRRICPATGQTVMESWRAEQKLLRELPATLPEPFDLVKTCSVHKDCSIRFEGRTYIVPFAYVGRSVEVRGGAAQIEIRDPKTGRLLVCYPRRTAERILIDERCYEGASTAEVAAPKPLGRMARRLQELAAQPVQRRSVDFYAALAEVAR
jgi:transposase